MPLKLKTSARKATFLLEQGRMRAEWELTSDMSEEEIISTLLEMIKFHRVTPGEADIIPLRAVPDDREVIPRPHPRSLGMGKNAPPTLAADSAKGLGWAAPVQPVPLPDSIAQAEASGFELIPPEEMGD